MIHLYAVFHPHFDHLAVINRMAGMMVPAPLPQQNLLICLYPDHDSARLFVQTLVRLLVRDQLAPNDRETFLAALPAGLPRL